MTQDIWRTIMTRQAEMVTWACEVIEPLRPFKVEDLKINSDGSVNSGDASAVYNYMLNN